MSLALFLFKIASDSGDLSWFHIAAQSACDAGDLSSISRSGRSSGEGNSNLLQYSCLENSMDRGVWWATVHGVAKSWRRKCYYYHNCNKRSHICSFAMYYLF